MNIRSKEKLAGGIVYTLLTLIVLSIIALAVVSLVSSMNGEETPQIAGDDYSPAENVTPYPAEQIIADENAEADAENAVNDENGGDVEINAGESGAAEEVISPSEGIKPDAEASESGAISGEVPEADEAENSGESEEKSEEALSPSAIPQSSPDRFVLPCKGSVTKEYSDDALVYSLTMNDYRAHLGIDVAATVGSPVYACADGVVSAIYDDPFMGKCMAVEHGGGLKSFYMNLSGEYPQGVREGAAVTCGQVIASVGETSLSEQADTLHLHFEMTLGQLHVNPANYVPYDSSAVMAYYEDAEPEK